MNRPVLLLLLLGCSDDYAFEAPKSGFEGDSDADTDADADVDTDADVDDAPPEVEDDFLRLRPAETDVFVFVVNPSRDTVTRVNVYSQAVDTIPVGRDPNLVLTTPDYSTAVIFNRGDDSLTLLDADSLDQRSVPLRDNYNQMAMSPDGAWVVLWHDLNAERANDPAPSGIISYNEASFVRLSDATHIPMTVGFNPKSVVFTPDSSLAVVVTDDALSMVDLTEPTPRSQVIPIAANPLNPPPAEEVVLAPDGSYAFVRQFGASDLALVDLSSKLVSRIPVGANPTDLDLTPDGRRAAVVARGDRQLWLYDVADPFATPEQIDLPDDSVYGSLLFEPSGTTGILYTNASLVDRYASWDLASGTITERSLVKPVQSMAITPTGSSLLVFHTLEDVASSTSASNPFHGSYAISVIGLADYRANPLRLPDEPIGYANSNNGDYGFFIMRDHGLLEVLDYRSLLYQEVRLKSVPVYVGVLPDLDVTDGLQPPAWVSQEHDLGRMTFYDPETGDTETITGFELNSLVE